MRRIEAAEWRVTWKREKGSARHRIFQTETAARRRAAFLDANRAWRPQYDDGEYTRDAPLEGGDITEVSVERRSVGEWGAAAAGSSDE